MKWIFDYEAPRWSKIQHVLKMLAILNNLKIDIDVDKGFIREAGIVSVQGSEDDISKFKSALNNAVAEYSK